MIGKLIRYLSYLALRSEIKRSGRIMVPVLATEDGYVLDGNRRVQIARELGLRSMPVLFIGGEVQAVSPSNLTITCEVKYD